ncbi:MAG: citrate lyase acyl carrier protein [Clostridiales bacterium]|nr:citrate lyase acyl carrier protein [Clostridiales bacterium]MDW7661713.1 citrate lyase acyl carrier protein [Bacillota bacterium]
MEIVKSSSAGTLDSCDIQIRIETNEIGTNEIYLKSVVEMQFGDQIKSLISGVLDKHNLKGVTVNAVDRGALDCTIKARVESAVMRALGREILEDWSVIHHDK